jgi:hypothetical protein
MKYIVKKLRSKNIQDLSGYPFKGTLSPDIVFYFKVYKFKSVLLVWPLIVFKFFYFVDL